MKDKLPLLQQAIAQLNKDNQTDLANELSALVEELLTSIENEETDQREQTKQDIDTFLETNKDLLQKHEELKNITNRKADLATLKGSLGDKQNENQEDAPTPTEKKGSRRERRGKTATKIAAGVGALFALFKLRNKKSPPSTPAAPATGTGSQKTPSGQREHLPTGAQRQRVLEEMEKIIAADKKKAIGYDFDDISLSNDRDINCSGLVYEVVQKRVGFKICTGGVTSASLYQSMLNKGWSVQPIIKKGTTRTNIQGIQPGDTVFRASTNPDFKRSKGGRPAKVNGMPIHHTAMIESVNPDGTFTVLESTGGAGVQVKTYSAQRRLNNRKDELHVVRMPYDQVG